MYNLLDTDRFFAQRLDVDCPVYDGEGCKLDLDTALFILCMIEIVLESPYNCTFQGNSYYVQMLSSYGWVIVVRFPDGMMKIERFGSLDESIEIVVMRMFSLAQISHK